MKSGRWYGWFCGTIACPLLCMAVVMLWTVAIALAANPMYLNRRTNALRVSPSGSTTYFHAPLNVSGWSPGTWTSKTPTPDLAWWGEDPDGTAGESTVAGTVTGTPVAAASPFCPTGAFSTPASCIYALHFEAGDYVTFDAGVGNIADTDDWTACSLVLVDRTSGDGTNPRTTTYANFNGGSAPGWKLQKRHEYPGVGYNDTALGSATLAAAGNTAVTDGPLVDGPYGFWGVWELHCVVYDRGVKFRSWMYASQQYASETHGDYSFTNPTAQMQIGDVDAAAPFTGQIVFHAQWASALTDAQITAMWRAWFGVDDVKGAAGSWAIEPGVASWLSDTNWTHRCCWIGGALHCYTDAQPLMGCQMPPGATGAGNPPAGGILFEPFKQEWWTMSRRHGDMTLVVDTTAVASTLYSPFADGRPVYRMTRTSGSTVPYFYYNVQNGQIEDGRLALQYYAMNAVDASPYTYIQVQWIGAGTCAGGVNTYFSQALTSTWTRYCLTTANTNPDCTRFMLAFMNKNNGTGTPFQNTIALINPGVSRDTCDTISYMEESVEGEGEAGGNQLSWDVSGQGWLDGSGNVKDGTTISLTWTPVAAAVGTAGVLLQIDDGTDTQAIQIGIDTSERFTFTTTPGGTDITTGVATLTPGTPIAITLVLDYTLDAYSLTARAVSGTSATARTSPTGLTTLRLSGDVARASAANGMISNVKVVR